jgi:adenine-specific DNA-methyltransferase
MNTSLKISVPTKAKFIGTKDTWYKIQKESYFLTKLKEKEFELEHFLANIYKEYKDNNRQEVLKELSIYGKNYQIQNRRYIGSKQKLTNWIMETIQKETEDCNSFLDIFAGTASVSKVAMGRYNQVFINDFLFSNEVIYKAFFDPENWDDQKINKLVKRYNLIQPEDLADNYFSDNFGNKFFDQNIAKIIGFIREDLEAEKTTLNSKEFAILLSSLIYSIDRLANTVGHFDAYIKKEIKKQTFQFSLIETADFDNVQIFREDANALARKVSADITYIDPPYNSRQYSRFYHVYENLVKWNKPNLYGVALKPTPENMSEYCTTKARHVFYDLVSNLDTKYLVVSYNNTYNSKSSSSVKKIELEEVKNILNKIGKTKTFQKIYKTKTYQYIETLLITTK